MPERQHRDGVAAGASMSRISSPDGYPPQPPPVTPDRKLAHATLGELADEVERRNQVFELESILRARSMRRRTAWIKDQGGMVP